MEAQNEGREPDSPAAPSCVGWLAAVGASQSQPSSTMIVVPASSMLAR